MKLLAYVFLSLWAFRTFSQLPGTEVWMFDITDGKGTISLDSGRNISQHLGYDNQPSFTDDGLGFFYTSAQADGQTETMFYDLVTKKSDRLTTTAESEYSARGPNKANFKCVRVEKDSSQRIYGYNLLNPTTKLLYPKVDSVGYFDEADWTLIYFKITDPATIWIADDGKEFVLSTNPGRCIKASLDKKKIYFTINTNGIHLLMRSEGLKNVFMQCNLPDSAEFFEFWDESTVLVSSKNGLQLFNLLTQSQTLVPLPEGISLQNITRLSISPDRKRLALVASE